MARRAAAAGRKAADGPLAIVCGAGAFPLAVADAVSKTRPVFLIGARGAASADIARFPHDWFRLGQVGRVLDLARGAGCTDILFVGSLKRPHSWFELRPDLTALRLLPSVWSVFRGGDDRLLAAVRTTAQGYGLRVRGVHEVAPGLMIPAGILGLHRPSKEAVAASRLGLAVLDSLGPYDIGQGAVVADRRVVAIEAAEGTNGMLDRIADLRAAGRLKTPASRCVFVKAAKRGQDIRLDTPAIGEETVARVKAAGIGGLAVAAQEVMAPDLPGLIAAADAAKLFVFGVERTP